MNGLKKKKSFIPLLQISDFQLPYGRQVTKKFEEVLKMFSFGNSLSFL